MIVCLTTFNYMDIGFNLDSIYAKVLVNSQSVEREKRGLDYDPFEFISFRCTDLLVDFFEVVDI